MTQKTRSLRVPAVAAVIIFGMITLVAPAQASQSGLAYQGGFLFPQSQFPGISVPTVHISDGQPTRLPDGEMVGGTDRAYVLLMPNQVYTASYGGDPFRFTVSLDGQVRSSDSVYAGPLPASAVPMGLLEQGR